MESNLDLPETVCKQVAQQLGLVLADLYLLFTKTQNFHWNLVDPRFHSLHLLFEEQYKNLLERIDEVAERIRMLGEKTPATLRQFLEMSSLEEGPDFASGNEMIELLLDDHEFIIRQLREMISIITELNDQGTVDLFIENLRFHEKAAWMLRSHLKSLT